jgi:DnaJ-class molecular chaperone
VLRPARVAKKKGRLTRRPSGRNGDLELEIAFKPHALFGFDAQRRLQCVVPVDIFEFLAGDAIDVPTLGGGSVRFDLAHGRVQKISGKGFPRRDGVPGVLVPIAQPVFPRQLSEREALYLRALASDLEQSGYARCAVVAAWGASAEEYLARAGQASTRPHSAHAKRRDQR